MRKTTEEWIELFHDYDPDKQTIKGYCAVHTIAGVSNKLCVTVYY